MKHNNIKMIEQKQQKKIEWNIGILSNLIVTALFFGITLFLEKRLIYSSFIVMGLFGLMFLLSYNFKLRRLPIFVVTYLVIVSLSGIVEYNMTAYKWITLETEYIHLGDVPLQTFRPADPSGTSKTYHFHLENIPSNMKILLNLKDVDPDERSGPLSILINDLRIMYLNRYFSDVPLDEEHKVSWRKVEISQIPIGYLKIGKNSVTITVEYTPFYGYDDINFFNLKIGYK